jgi:hypothetical protein
MAYASSNMQFKLSNLVAVYSALMTKNRPDSARTKPNHPEEKTIIYPDKRAHFRNPSDPQIPNP